MGCVMQVSRLLHHELPVTLFITHSIRMVNKRTAYLLQLLSCNMLVLVSLLLTDPCCHVQGGE